MLHLWQDESGGVATLGNKIMEGMRPQIVVPGGVWQGARLRAGGAFALMGTTVAPGFDFAYLKHGGREDLIKNYPDHEAMITALTLA
jgi:predicted cupin superfamily sugar epimerase